MTVFGTEKRLIRKADVLGMLPISESTLWRMIAKAEFPKPVKIGGSSVWVECEIDDWVQAQIDKRGEDDLI